MEVGGPISQLAMTQLKLSTNMVKSAAQAEKNVASMIDQAAQNAAASTGGRGSIVNITA